MQNRINSICLSSASPYAIYPDGGRWGRWAAGHRCQPEALQKHALGVGCTRTRAERLGRRGGRYAIRLLDAGCRCFKILDSAPAAPPESEELPFTCTWQTC